MNALPATPVPEIFQNETFYELGGRRAVFDEHPSPNVVSTAWPDKAGNYGIAGLSAQERAIVLRMGVDKTKVEDLRYL
jgi:hypothetical protein